MSDLMQVQRSIGKMEGQIEGIHSTQTEILVHLKAMNKWSTSLHSASERHAENISNIKADLDKTKTKVEALHTSKARISAVLAFIAFLFGGLGTALSRIFFGGGA